MKIAIITIVDFINYGNRFQNYAMQEILKEMGYEVDTIVSISFRRYALNFMKKVLNFFFPQVIHKKRPYVRREVSFENFTEKYIKQKKICTINGRIPQRINKQYDFFVVGSDQIWNPEFIWLDVANGGIYNRFLQFAKPQQKIAVAPSFGVSLIPRSLIRKYAKSLKDFKALSVREESGADIISTLIGYNSDILIDPTLMLSITKWKKIETCPEFDISKPYLIKFILGHQDYKEKLKIDSIAKKHGLVIYDVMDNNNLEMLNIEPNVFLSLIDNATLICTDSFHATVFSIIFDKPFLLFERNDNGTLSSMNSRLITLLKKLKLENRLPGKVEDKDIFFHDYSEAYMKLDMERKKFMNYLQEALKIGEV